MRLVVVVNKRYTMEAKAYMFKTKRAAISKIHTEYIKAMHQNTTLNPYDCYISEEDMYAYVSDGVMETEIRGIQIEES